MLIATMNAIFSLAHIVYHLATMSSGSERDKRPATTTANGRFSPSTFKDKIRSRRCGKCEGCLRENCGHCAHCLKPSGPCSRRPCLGRVCLSKLEYKKKSGAKKSSISQSNPNRTTRVVVPASASSYAASSATELGSSSQTVPPENRLDWQVLNKFRPTAYLMLEDKEHGPEMKRFKTSTHAADAHPTSNSSSLYGLPIPSLPIENLCSSCRRRTDLNFDESNPILLCDGCEREFHLHCLQPRYTFVPEGDFYCWDCSPTGTTRSLEVYLEEVDQGRHVYATRADYIRALQTKLAALYDTTSHNRKRNSKANDDEMVVPRRFPDSELDLAYVQKIQTIVDGHEHTRDDAAIAAAGPDILVGKPVELCFNDVKEGERFHTGRIVDFRPTWNTWYDFLPEPTAARLRSCAGWCWKSTSLLWERRLCALKKRKVTGFRRSCNFGVYSP
jgi:hypothetical protein